MWREYVLLCSEGNVQEPFGTIKTLLRNKPYFRFNNSNGLCDNGWVYSVCSNVLFGKYASSVFSHINSFLLFFPCFFFIVSHIKEKYMLCVLSFEKQLNVKPKIIYIPKWYGLINTIEFIFSYCLPSLVYQISMRILFTSDLQNPSCIISQIKSTNPYVAHGRNYNCTSTRLAP